MKPLRYALLASGRASAQERKPGGRDTAAGLYDLSAIAVPPKIINRPVLARVADGAFARELQPAGARGTVMVRFRVEVDGTASRLVIPDSTVDVRVQRAAFTIVRAMRFSPALVNRRPVAVPIEVPLTYDVPPTPSATDTTTPRGN